MKKTLSFFLVACLASALSFASPLAANARVSTSTSAATLASVGTCEMDVAADWTALIMSRKQATARLQRGQITVDQAVQVQTLGDAARDELDAACAHPSLPLEADRREAARAKLREINHILEK
jgi:hypothetical protein